MHKLVLFLFITIGFCTNAQVSVGVKKYFDSIYMRLKPLGDSISTSIDSQALLKTMDDTTYVRNMDDPNLVEGYLVEQTYSDNAGLLKKAVLVRHPDKSYQKSYIYYYDRSILIKAVVNDLQTGELSYYYYSKEENDLNGLTINRITKAYPEFAAYYDNLETGRSFIKQMLKKSN
jgi:hypothetical protein